MRTLLDVAVLIADRDGRTVVGGTVFHDGQGGLTRHVVHLFLHGLAVHDVGEADDALFFGHEGFVEGVPLGQHGALGHFLTVGHMQAGAVGQDVLEQHLHLRLSGE